MSPEINAYLYGALSLGCLVIGLRFLRFWRLSRDRFFIWFGVAFGCFAADWTLAALAPGLSEHGYVVFLPRLVGFALILAGIFDKNRRSG